MTLIKCKVCHHIASSYCDYCPHCDTPISISLNPIDPIEPLKTNKTMSKQKITNFQAFLKFIEDNWIGVVVIFCLFGGCNKLSCDKSKKIKTVIKKEIPVKKKQNDFEFDKNDNW